MSSKKPDEPGVLGSLPSTRPARIGRRREGAGAATTEEPPKPAAKPRARAGAVPNGGAAKPRKATARSAGRAKPPARAKAPNGETRPRAVRSGAPALERAAEGRREPPPVQHPAGPPRGAELVTTAVKATGELAQIGFTVGGQMLKRAVRRLPRP